MKKAISLLIAIAIALFCIAGCGKTITGEMVTEGKVVVIGERAVQQERSDGKSEYMANITNLPVYRQTLSDALNTSKSVKIFWSVEKDTKDIGGNYQKNTIIRIE